MPIVALLPIASAVLTYQGLRQFDASCSAGALAFGGGNVVLPLLKAVGARRYPTVRSRLAWSLRCQNSGAARLKLTDWLREIWPTRLLAGTNIIRLRWSVRTR
jgi:hypothetical protein